MTSTRNPRTRRLAVAAGLACAGLLLPQVAQATPVEPAHRAEPAPSAGPTSQTTHVRPIAQKGNGVQHKTKSKGQLDGGQAYLRNIRMCARWTFRSSWKVKVSIDKNQKIWAFQNPRMLDPKLEVKLTKNCKLNAPARKSSRVVTRTRLSASNFSMRLCSWNPSVTLSVPWSASVGVAPSCEDDARRASRYRVLEPGSPQSRLSVASTGKAAEWKKFGYWHDDENDKSLKACFKLRVYLDIQNARGSDSDDKTMAPVTDNFCLPIGSWAMAMAGRS